MALIGGGNRSTRRKTDLPQVTDKTVSHNVVYNTPHLSGIRTHKMPVMIGTDYIGSANYHTITTTTVPAILMHDFY